MTRRESVNAQTPRARVNDKKVGRLERASSGRRERRGKGWGRQLINGEAQEMCGEIVKL